MKDFATFFKPVFVKRFFVAAFIVVFSFTAFSQDAVKDYRYGGYARLHAMGDNPFIVDPSNIKVNPAYASDYSNFLWGDIGSSVGNPASGFGQFAGFNYSLDKNFTLGALLTRDDFGMMSIGSLDPGGLVNLVNTSVPAANIVPMDNNLELLAAYDLGNYVIGLGVAYASTKNDFTPATGTGDKNSASQFGVNLGFMGDINPNFKFDFSFGIVLPSVSYEPGTGDKVNASNTFMGADARGFLKLSSKFTLVPTITFYNGSGKVEVGTTSTDLTSVMGFGVGVGLTYQVANLIVSGGPSFAYESETTAAVANVSPETKDSRMIFPVWNLGAEWYFTDWLIGRLGYVASTSSNTNQSVATATTINENTRTAFGRGDVRLGVGFRFGGFTLDATVNDDTLREGFNLIGGGTHSFAYLSSSFAF